MKRIILLLLLIQLFILSPLPADALIGGPCCPPRGMDTVPGFYNTISHQCEYSNPGGGGIISINPSCIPGSEICDTSTYLCAATPTNPPTGQPLPTPNANNGDCNDPFESCCTREMFDDVGHEYTEYYCTNSLSPTSQSSSCSCSADNNPESEEKYVFFVCNNIPTDNPNKAQCEYCLQRNGIWTAVGCLDYSVDGFIQNILQLAIGLGGGIALLLMIFGAFKISASAGDPKAAQSGKEVFGGAIAGLLIIIFSVVILNLIGVEIIKIPGF